MDHRLASPPLNQNGKEHNTTVHKTMGFSDSQQRQEAQRVIPAPGAPSLGLQEQPEKVDEGVHLQQQGEFLMSGEHWKEYLQRLRAFHSKHGHLRVSSADGDLWEWLKFARQQYKKFILGLNTSMKQEHLVQVRRLDPNFEIFPLDPEKLNLIASEQPQGQGSCHPQNHDLIGSEISCVHTLPNIDSLAQHKLNHISPLEMERRTCSSPPITLDEGSSLSDMVSWEPTLADETDENENERMFMEKLDREIFDAEEVDLMERIERSIRSAESMVVDQNVEKSTDIASGVLRIKPPEKKSAIGQTSVFDRHESYKSDDVSDFRNTASKLTLKKRRLSSEDSFESSTVSFAPETKRIVIPDVGESFLDFKRVFSIVAKLEFEPLGIDTEFALGHMWGRHKELFGSTCGESCPCVCHLDTLTDSVERNYLSAGKSMPKYPKSIGFASRFAKFFIAKINSINSAWARSEVIQHLLLMWKAHERDPMLGSICRNGCTCTYKLECEINAPNTTFQYKKDQDGDPCKRRKLPKTCSANLSSEVSFNNDIDSEASNAEAGSDGSVRVQGSIASNEDSTSIFENRVSLSCDGLRPPQRTAWATAFKILPKYLGGLPKNPVIRHEDFAGFKEQLIPKLMEKGLTRESCEVRSSLEDIPNDPNSWNLKVSGESSALDRFLIEFKHWFYGRLRDYNLKILERSGVEIEARLSASSNLGAKIKRSKFDFCRGLEIQSISARGQLAKTLGPRATSHGAFVVMIDGIACDVMRLKEFRDLMRTKSTISLTFLLPSSADLSGFDLTPLIRGPSRLCGETDFDGGEIHPNDDNTDEVELPLTISKTPLVQDKRLIDVDDAVLEILDSQDAGSNEKVLQKRPESVGAQHINNDETKSADLSEGSKEDRQLNLPNPLSRGGIVLTTPASVTSPDGSFGDLLWLLRHLTQANHVPTESIEFMRFCLKAEIASLEQTWLRNGTKDGYMRLRDLQFRDTILKIYSIASDAAVFVKSARRWVRCCIRIRKVKLELPTIWNKRLSMEAYADLHSPPKRLMLPTFPQKVMNTDISYDECAQCEINFNPIACPERALGIDLWTVDGSRREQIGVARVTWEDLQSALDENEKRWTNFSIKILPLYDPLHRKGSHIGSMDISVCHRAVATSELQNEQKEVTRSIWTVLDLVNEYNKNLLPSEHAEGKIVLQEMLVSGDMTMLDIANALHDQQLVRKLGEMLDCSTEMSMDERQNMGQSPVSKSCDITDRLPSNSKKARFENTSQSSTRPDGTNRTIEDSETAVQTSSPRVSFANSSPVDKSAKITLPMVSHADWLVHELGAERFVCRFHNDYHGCKKGCECLRIHVQMPWGQEFDKLWKRMGSEGTFPFERPHFLTHVRYNEACDSAGKTWVTAGYCNYVGKPKTMQEAMYAEGGSFARVSKQGISWYATRDDALKALERVITLSHWAAEHQIKPQALKYAPEQRYVREPKYVPEYVKGSNKEGLVTSLTRRNHSKTVRYSSSEGMVTRSGRMVNCNREEECQSIDGDSQASTRQRRTAEKSMGNSGRKNLANKGYQRSKDSHQHVRYDSPSQPYYDHSTNGRYEGRSYDENRRYDIGRSRGSREVHSARKSWSSHEYSKHERRWGDRSHGRR